MNSVQIGQINIDGSKISCGEGIVIVNNEIMINGIKMPTCPAK